MKTKYVEPKSYMSKEMIKAFNATPKKIVKQPKKAAKKTDTKKK